MNARGIAARSRRVIGGAATTATGAAAAGGAAFGHWGVSLALVCVTLLLGLAQLVMPQNSGDRAKVWALVIGYAQFKVLHRSSAGSPLDPRAARPNVIQGGVVTDAPQEPPSSEEEVVRSRRALGTRLKAERIKRKLTMSVVAAHLGCSTSKVSRLEAGGVGARKPDIERLAQLYRISDSERRHWLDLVRQGQPTSASPADRLAVMPTPSLREAS